MAIIIFLVLGTIGGYLIGSVSSAITICHLLGLPDPRTSGSKNPGATNVLRIGGRVPALLTLLGDMLKGWLPVFITKLYTNNPWVLGAVLLATILGHIFPLFFNFKGGKGVATAIGGILGISCLLGGIFLITWLLIFMLWQYSSLAALVAIVSMPLWAAFLIDHQLLPTLIILTIIIVWRHRENIQRLLRGQETKSLRKKIE